MRSRSNGIYIYIYNMFARAFIVHERVKSACQRLLTLEPPISLWLANMAVYSARSRCSGGGTAAVRLPENYEAAFTRTRATGFDKRYYYY
jgi:hypothetical protein